MRIIFPIILMAGLIPCSSLSAQSKLPGSGSCTLSINEPLQWELIVTWANETATIVDGGKFSAGRILGLRQHDKGFKLSVAYNDKIMGDTEVVIFSYGDPNFPSYRMAIITYDNLEGGLRLISSVQGFKDARCHIS